MIDSTFDDHTSHASSGVGGVDAGFFERERSRLIQDISKGVESILGNSNTLNRKLEESISVGKEFHPISELWSKFEKIMIASGIPNLTTPIHKNNTTIGGEEKYEPPIAGSTPKKTEPSDTEQEGKQQEQGGIKFETTASVLPPGVAPGGGRIYA